jgi:hypothetical protein
MSPFPNNCRYMLLCTFLSEQSQYERLLKLFSQVSREKAIADEEELKVNQINKEVSTKQKDCEEDLKKAEPGEFCKLDVHK